MKWGQYIRDYRTKCALSQSELAMRLGVKQATIARWENGYFSPKMEMQSRIQDMLGMTAGGPSDHAVGRVANNINANLLFTRGGEYIVMSAAAEHCLSEIHQDAGPYAEAHQEKHFRANAGAAREAGFFDGRVEHVKILRPWFRGRSEIVGFVEIVWTPLEWPGEGIVVESNFRRIESPVGGMMQGGVVQIIPFQGVRRSRFVPGHVLEADGRR